MATTRAQGGNKVLLLAVLRSECVILQIPNLKLKGCGKIKTSATLLLMGDEVCRSDGQGCRSRECLRRGWGIPAKPYRRAPKSENGKGLRRLPVCGEKRPFRLIVTRNRAGRRGLPEVPEFREEVRQRRPIRNNVSGGGCSSNSSAGTSISEADNLAKWPRYQLFNFEPYGA